MIVALTQRRRYIGILLRLCVALSLVISVITAGYLKRSAFSIFIFTSVFTILYILGKLPAWKVAYREGGLVRLLVSAMISFPIQCILVSILYFIGFGVSSFISGDSTRLELSRLDLIWAIGLLFGGAFLGFLITVSEASRDKD